MPLADDIPVNDQVTLPGHELWLEFSHASGPGGQNVNKLSTRATLCWSVDASGALTPEQKRRVRTRLRSRISVDGVLRVSSSRRRSQLANRREAERRLAELLAEALQKPKPRIPTKPSRASQERRLSAKKRRGDLKRARGAIRDW
ncbi:MAG: alternative ribosome rescue aminoacyl-tRNA hydrolase ArfB [Acidobacteriota bacterium]|jgi:ribosome-associated protein|nr:alternative ribosome rescue aminoacyl-tRNA hydrolase ArfB [Acidobacteriota bacterium]